MANSFLTLDAITREAVRLFTNSNAFIQNLDRQYDDQFARSGAKIGTALRIRLPNDYTVRSGAAASVQDTAEQSTTLTVADQRGVDIGASTLDRTMSMDDFSERYMAPMVNNLVGKVAGVIMAGSEGNVCNLVQNVDGSNNALTPIMETFLTAGAVLTDNSAPQLDRMIVNDPYTNARTVSLLAGLFNPQQPIGDQYRSGVMRNALGFDWMEDPTVIKHTAGTFSAGGTVNGAGQTGTSITVNAITGTLEAGDIITFAGVNAVNRVTKVDTGALRQFVVAADVATAGTSVTIYPAMTPAVGGADVQYQTVTASPANGAAMSLVNKASGVTRRSIAFVREAITMVSADLEMPGSSASEEARVVFDGVSIRMATQWSALTDQKVTRTDVLFGHLFIRPEWCCIVADKI